MNQQLDELFTTCALCRVCDGAAYQTPPVLGITDGNEPILVIAQNPGEIKPDDPQRSWWVKHFAKGTTQPTVMRGWYQWDFETSHGYTMFEKVFGTKWLESGVFAYTNAVRCRTVHNQAPSEQMQEACRTYTRTLSEGRKGIIYVGAMAATLLSPKTLEKVRPGAPMRTRDGLVLRFPHYAAWKSNDEVNLYARSVALMVKEVTKT